MRGYSQYFAAWFGDGEVTVRLDAVNVDDEAFLEPRLATFADVGFRLQGCGHRRRSRRLR